MENKRSSSFGRYLKTVRLEKGIKLSDIFQQTRISKVTLELIEAEDHARLPAEVFVIGFLRAYARVVGADENVAVEGFLESRRLMDEGVQFERNGDGPRSKAGGRLLIFLGIFVMLIAVAVFVLQATKPVETIKQVEPVRTPDSVVVKEKADVGKEAAVAVKESVSADKETPMTEQAISTEPEKAEQPDESIAPEPDTDAQKEDVGPGNGELRVKQRISIQVVEDTWLKVIVDSLSTNEYSLEPGDTLELDADKGFSLLIGNATGIRLTYNGKPVSVPGKSGQVVTIQLP